MVVAYESNDVEHCFRDKFRTLDQVISHKLRPGVRPETGGAGGGGRAVALFAGNSLLLFCFRARNKLAFILARAAT